MNFIKCASRYMIKKKNRSILLILLLSTIFILILTVVSVAAYANAAIEQMENNFSREFIVNAHHAPGSLTLERIAEISHRDDIAAYRLISNATPVEFANDGGKPLSVKTDGDNCFVSPGFEHAGTLVSNVTSDSDELFSNGTFSLISGRHIEDSDEGKILIHKELADRNFLRLGDTIQMKFSQAIVEDMENMGYDTSHMNTGIIQAEIIGIFESQGEGDMKGMHLSHQLYENYCYIDLHTYSSVWNPKSQRFFCQAAFSAASASDLAVVIKEIKNLDWPAGQPDNIVSDLDHYDGMIGSLSSLSNLLRIILICMILGCITLIYCLLSHSVKQRKQEIGIMMSLGLSRGCVL
ncbi:ABC transporter permease [Blautia schinkii]|nr:ABC transporter permease [Blautia schinkii]